MVIGLRFGIVMQRCERLPWHGVKEHNIPYTETEGLITLVRGLHGSGLRLVTRLPAPRQAGSGRFWSGGRL